MKEYLLNSSSKRLHRSDSVYKSCKSMKEENKKFYDSIEEVKSKTDSPISLCKICMSKEIDKFGHIIKSDYD